MKICMILQRRFTKIGNAMAYNIKKEIPDAEFCSLVHTRASLEYLESQKDVAYTSFIFDEDIHKKLFEEKIDFDYLKWIETEYGLPNLWPYLYVDRVIMNGQLVREYPYDKASLSYEDMLRKIQVCAKAVIAFLEKEKPDVVVFPVLGNTLGMLLHHIAQKRGVRIIIIDFARLGNRISLTEDWRTLTWVKDKFEEIQDGRRSEMEDEAKKFLEDFRNNPVPYDADTATDFYNNDSRLKNIRFLKPQNLFKSIYWHLETFAKDLKKIKNKDYTDIYIWWQIWDKMKRKVRGLVGCSDLYTDIKDANARFAYYPLHTDPEIATMLLAPYYTNQCELIKTIARALPIDMLLYVKEHPGMVGFRTRKFYKEILKAPNVRLIHPAVKGGVLTEKSSLTVTISSTAGLESIFLKKPVITFGDVFYNDIPGVKRCRGYEELPYLVKEQLEVWQHDEETLVNYISALLEDSVDVYFADMWNRAASFEEVVKDRGIIELSKMLSRKILDFQK